MSEPTHKAHIEHHNDPHALGTALGPVLRETCEGRLGEIEWFRCVWQHGGAATGFSTWQLDDGRRTPVVVKLPVGGAEHRWTTALGGRERWGEGGVYDSTHASALPTPRVLAEGTQIDGYDLAWLVIERLEGQPLSLALSKDAVNDLLRAAADFHMAAGAARQVEAEPRPPDWAGLLHKARELTRVGGLNESQRWNEAVKKVQKALPVLTARWASRRVATWCHGDLHPANAMRRAGSGEPGGRHGCVLIDLALVHPGHWVEDAVYLERLYWGRQGQLHEVKPVSTLAHFRRERGLPPDDAYAELAMVRRVLMAACVPVFLEREGHPKYTHAALELIDHYLPQVAR